MKNKMYSGHNFKSFEDLKVAIMCQDSNHGLIPHDGSGKDVVWWIHDVSTLNIEDGSYYGTANAEGFDGDEIENCFDVSNGDVLLPFSGAIDKNDNRLHLGDVVGVNGMIGEFTVVFDFCAFLLRHNDGKYEDKPIGFILNHNLTKVGSVYD